MKQPKAAREPAGGSPGTRSVRNRVLGAAFAAFMQNGYERTSTLEIATRARVSKREIYALFASKQAMLAACITERAEKMRLPLDLPAPTTREALAATLGGFGTTVLGVVCGPSVLAVYRLAIAESDGSPEIARMLDQTGRGANRAALVALLGKAQASGLIGSADPATLAAQFAALMWDDLLVRLLLRVTRPPGPAEMAERARAAAAALLALHPAPGPAPADRPDGTASARRSRSKRR
jgi:AcrR family transcriptional regulator